MFNNSVDELIKIRTSWRTYEASPIPGPVKEKITEILKLTNTSSPFPGECRFEWFNMDSVPTIEKKQYGTYGFIEGARNFILGAASNTKYGWENYGYLLEYIILAATDMELGTCWLGGTFHKSSFAQQLHLSANEKLPAITPIGVPKKRRIKENLIRTAIRAKKRKNWNTLFFKNDTTTPLFEDQTKNFHQALENVRLGPSASNKQPWRIIKEENNHIFHFYVIDTAEKRESVYQNLRKLDIGIAVCHFDLTMQEKKISGQWFFKDPAISSANKWHYTISWKTDLS